MFIPKFRYKLKMSIANLSAPLAGLARLARITLASYLRPRSRQNTESSELDLHPF